MIFLKIPLQILIPFLLTQYLTLLPKAQLEEKFVLPTSYK